MTDAEILAAVAVAAGGACHSATGFGFALVSAPLVVAALPPEEAIPTLLLLGILASALTLATEARRPKPLWGDSAQILAWGAAGAIAGAVLLERLDRTALQLLVSASVIAALLARELAKRRRPDPSSSKQGPEPLRRAALAGAAAGVLTTTTTANGPPLLLYLLGRRAPAAAMRDTLSVLFVSFGAIGIAAIALGPAELTLPGPLAGAVFAAATAAGHVTGRPLFRRLAAGRYEQVVVGLLLASVAIGAALQLV